MSKVPEESINISPAFQKRMIQLISEEETESGHCSNAEFAARVGISPNTISKITSYGIIPSTKSIVKIADYLQVSIPYLLAKTDDNSFEPALQPVTFQERLKQLIRVSRRIRQIAAVRAARKDNSLRVHFLNLLNLCLIRINLTVYITFPDPSCNKLIVLSAEIKDDH